MQNKLKRTKSAPKSPIKKQKGYFWLAVTSVILTIGIIFGGYLFVNKVNEINYVQANIGNELFSLEVADKDAARVKGLSERNGLEPNTGMLFDFQTEGNRIFWMKQMRFKIDIAWLNSEKQILYIKNNANPDDFPERYSSEQPARYVIELDAGEFERLNVKASDYVDF